MTEEQKDLGNFGEDFWTKPEEKQTELPLVKKRKTYPQDWSSYNLSKTQEKLMLLKILHHAVESIDIDNIYKGNGRPKQYIQDMIKACCLKVYCKSPSRNIISDLKLAESLGFLAKTPHFNSINNYMSDPSITKYLNELIKITAEPLIPIEKYFAVDSTGFATFNKKHWIDIRFTNRSKKDWKKLHILTGVKSNIIASAKVTKGNEHDSPHFDYLVKNSIYFNIKEISADAGYLGRKNCDIVTSIGAMPFIMPKKNVKKSKPHSSVAWGQMISLWLNNEKEFRKHYHRRSNVESTFAMIKKNLLPYVRSKSDVGQENEVLMKVICHNICVLIASIFEFGIKIKFIE